MAVFQVLGPLSIRGLASPLRGSTVRRLLAALLCRANDVVTVEDLMSALWGEHAPPTARKTLQVYVRRLRMALDTEQRIVYEASGYRILVAPAELDASRFSQLVTSASDARPEQAVDLLQQALNLWCGDAFGGVREHSPIADEARRLDEERLRIEAWHAALSLKLGRHAQLVPYLRKLTEEQPYREDLRGHLMLALYRCGRQTDALELFRDTRNLLTIELGVEPGPELRRLHEAILRSDSSLDLQPPSRATVPRELPAEVAGFVGRIEQLRSLNEMMSDASPVVISAIDGSAGVGKTSLAVHWAHQVASQFPDGQLYINLRGFDPSGPPVSPSEAVRRFLDALGVGPQRLPASAEAQAAMFRSLLADRRMLVLLDNARDAEQVRPLLPGSSGCLVVLTSRNRMSSLIATSGGQALMLDVLTITEARQLLAARLGHARLRSEPQAVTEIIKRCARLPLALAIAAARAATEPDLTLAALATEMSDAQRRLDALDGGDPLTDLRVVFSWSVERLSPAAAQLFRQLGLHPGPDASTAAVASLAGLPLQQVQALLDELKQAHLTTEPIAGRYTFHDLLRAYATEQAHRHDTEADNQAAMHRVIDHYLHTAHAADKLLHPVRRGIALDPARHGVRPEILIDREHATAWLETERTVLLSTVRLAVSTEFDAAVWQLAWSLCTYLDWQGYWNDMVAIHRDALAVTERLEDRSGHAYALGALGRAYVRLTNYDQAHAFLSRALDLLEHLGDHVGQANIHMMLNLMLQQQGRFNESLVHGRQALVHFQATANPVGQARCLNALGWTHSELGEYRETLELCGQALTLLRDIDDRDNEAGTWDTLGYAHHHLGNHGLAIGCYEKALALYRIIGNRYYEACTLVHLGDTHHTASDLDAARNMWRRGLSILTELEHPDSESVRDKLDRLVLAVESLRVSTANH